MTMNLFNKLSMKLKEEVFSFSLKERFFIFSILPCIFLIMVEYGITSPASNSLFISNYSAHFFPYVWVFTVPLNFLVIYCYNRFLPNLGCYKTFFATCFLICFVNALCSLFLNQFPFLIFFQYAWKDIYILLMFKQLWSMIHSTIQVSKSKYFYTLPFAVGSIGAIIGSLIPGFFALSLGSSTLFLFTIPIYLLVFCGYIYAIKYSNLPKAQKEFKEKLFSNSNEAKGILTLFKESKYLTAILLLVIFMQLSVALMHYQFNIYLEKAFVDVDLRTAYTGKLHGMISSVTILFQCIGTSILIFFLGIKRSHLIVPLTLFLNSLLFLIKPTFSVVSYLYASIKSIDFSFFTPIREQLYGPLNTDEKFRAKAVIDVFAYRSSKAIASFLLLFLQQVVLDLSLYIAAFMMFVYVLWFFTVIVLFKSKPSEVRAV